MAQIEAYLTMFPIINNIIFFKKKVVTLYPNKRKKMNSCSGLFSDVIKHWSKPVQEGKSPFQLLGYNPFREAKAGTKGRSLKQNPLRNVRLQCLACSACFSKQLRHIKQGITLPSLDFELLHHQQSRNDTGQSELGSILKDIQTQQSQNQDYQTPLFLIMVQ